MRRAMVAATSIVLGLGVGLLVAVTLPAFLGYRTLAVVSGSMSPEIRVGDAVVTRGVSPADVRPGDVITFRDPSDRDRLITHRLRSITLRGDDFEVVTKGDANDRPESWSVPADGRIGLVLFEIPVLGYVLAYARSVPGRLLLIVVPTLWLAGVALARIWRPRPKEERARA